MDNTRETRLSRRRFLWRASAIVGASAIAGCSSNENGDDEPEPTPDPDDDSGSYPGFVQIEDPPAAVYLPTHRDAMQMGETVRAGEYAISPMFSYPHQFWIVTGDQVERVEPRAEDELHLMVTAWDPETGLVLPIDTGLNVTIEADGEVIDQRAPWPMISQGMGFHFGDNVALDGDGTYEISVRVGPLDVRRTGQFGERFDEPATATFEFEFDDAFRHDVVSRIDWLDEAEWGTPGAIPPMGHQHEENDGHGDHDSADDHGEHDDHEDNSSHDDNDDRDDHDGNGGHEDDVHHGEHGGNGDGEHDGNGEHAPYSAQPPAEALPGTLLGAPESGDAVFVTKILEPGSRFAADDAWYLVVSPRTPYNESVLPAMQLSGSISRDDESTSEPGVDLVPTLDDELGYHHGASVDDVESGDVLTLTVETPPQVARHQGYETAFVSMPEMELHIEGGDDA